MSPPRKRSTKTETHLICDAPDNPQSHQSPEHRLTEFNWENADRGCVDCSSTNQTPLGSMVEAQTSREYLAGQLLSVSGEEVRKSWRAGLLDLCISTGLDHQERTDRQHIHAGALETIDGLLWSADDGLILVEARVQDDGDASLPME